MVFWKENLVRGGGHVVVVEEKQERSHDEQPLVYPPRQQNAPVLLCDASLAVSPSTILGAMPPAKRDRDRSKIKDKVTKAYVNQLINAQLFFWVFQLGTLCS